MWREQKKNHTIEKCSQTMTGEKITQPKVVTVILFINCFKIGIISFTSHFFNSSKCVIFANSLVGSEYWIVIEIKSDDFHTK